MAKIKIILTESQMKFLMENSRLDYLKNQFGFISNDEWEQLSKKDLSKIKTKKGDEIKNISLKALMNPEGDLLALTMVEETPYIDKETGKQEIGKKIKLRLSEKVFDDATNADPSDNNMYTQWILKTFANLIKKGETEEAIRFIDEDLPQANEYLKIFDEVKNSKLFTQTNKNVAGLPTNPTDINQYLSLSQLYSAVDPFIEKEENQLANDIKKYVAANRAKILFQDSNWLVYNPLDRDANCVMSAYASWCTAKPENTMFNKYTKDYLEPNGEPSKIYVLINKDVLKGKSNEVYQFHFESEQFKDRTNDRNVNIYDFLQKNHNLSNFFKGILSNLAKKSGSTSILNNKYLKILMEIGELDNLLDYFDTNTDELNFKGFKIAKLPENINKFKNLTTLNLIGVGLKELPNSIGDLSNLESLILSNNELKNLPDSIGKLKNLLFLNITNNPIKQFPKTMIDLSGKEGGKITRIAYDSNNFSNEDNEMIENILSED